MTRIPCRHCFVYLSICTLAPTPPERLSTTHGGSSGSSLWGKQQRERFHFTEPRTVLRALYTFSPLILTRALHRKHPQEEEGEAQAAVRDLPRITQLVGGGATVQHLPSLIPTSGLVTTALATALLLSKGAAAQPSPCRKGKQEPHF